MEAKRLFSLRPSDVGIQVLSLDEMRDGMATSPHPPEQIPGQFAQFIGEVLGKSEPIVVAESSVLDPGHRDSGGTELPRTPVNSREHS